MGQQAQPNIWQKTHAKPLRQETHEEIRQSHSGKKRIKKKQDKATTARKKKKHEKTTTTRNT